MITTTQLTSDFKQHFKIDKIVEQKPKSGQKQVYIVDIAGKRIALKIMPTNDERIQRELKIYDEFKDVENIPCVIDIQPYGDELVVLEEYIEGTDLCDKRVEYLNNSKLIRKLIFDMAQILEPIWSKGYIHRDLKPQNIIIRNGQPVILDFGIARDLEDETITPTGFQPFSWPFAAPEQYFYKKDQISYRTDFFCLGIIAFFLFTGKLPFGNSKPVIAQKFNEDQIFFDVGDHDMNVFLNATLKYRVAERPRTIDLFLKNLCL